MDDENGLELSLGLGCGGSSTKLKGINGSSSDTRIEEGDNGSKMVDDFKKFHHGNAQKQESSTGSRRSDSVKPQENFFNDLFKADNDANASMNLNTRGFWVSSSNRSSEIEVEKQSDEGNKRKMLFDEISSQKKHERDARNFDLHNKKTSHISLTEDGSSAENEDVAESEVQGSLSRLVTSHDDLSKRFTGVGDPSEVSNEVRGSSNSNVVVVGTQNRLKGSAENELTNRNLNFGVPFSVLPMNVMNFPYSFTVKDSDVAGATGASGHSLTGIVPMMPTQNGEQRTGAQYANQGNLPVMFGYSPVHLPTLDKDNTWGMASQLQQFQPSFVGWGPPNSDKPVEGMSISQDKHLAAMQMMARNSSDFSLYNGRATGRSNVEGERQATEEGSSSQTEDDVKGSSSNLKAKDVSEQSTGECLDYSVIKAGMAADLKFGGCGSYPNLPWVSTTGTGPNGKTISGVTYRFSGNQIRIVCACHGSHMSPEEFVRHANGENISTNGLATLASSNPAASAQS